MANKRAYVFQLSFKPTTEHKIKCEAKNNEEKPIDVIREIVYKHYKGKEPFGWKEYLEEIKNL